jgi:glycosyltransferase involved in cell wall biosynthesis
VKELNLKVTVIIATYNRAQLLRQTLESLTRQTRPADEILVVDNNSSDSTKAVAGEYSDKLPLRYVFEAKQGVAFARNCGIRNATGDILAFTDDDCHPEPEWLEYLELPFLRDPDIGLVGGRIVPRPVQNLNLVERYSAAIHILNESPQE